MDPIKKLIDWQIRSQDLEKIKEKVRSFRRFFEDLFVDALDEKYRKNEKSREIEDGETDLGEDPKNFYLTDGK